MQDWPRLTIVILTYASSIDSPRATYAERALKAVLDRLTYSGQIHVHVADDGSPEKHRENLRQIAGGYSHVVSIGTSNSEQSGYGASWNLATQQVHLTNGVVLPLEDDWELVHNLNVDGYVQALVDCSPVIGCIRLGYLGYTQALRGELGVCAGRQYLLFDPSSPERHVCSGHPRLETAGWERAVGPWPEGLDPGSTEHEWCGIPAARTGVAWPMDTPPGGWWVHIGTVQARSDQYVEAAVS